MTLLERLKDEASLAYRRYQEAPPRFKERCLEEYRRAYACYKKQELMVDDGTRRSHVERPAATDA
jgi:hypothetical protein